MRKPLILQPPEIVEASGNAIFLAGPIQGAPDWQSEAAEIIHKMNPEIIVASPRKAYKDGKFIYEDQVDWETHYLRRAGDKGVVLFWLAKQVVDTPGRAYAQTTRFELAEWKMRHERDGAKLVVGIEEGFGNERYIKRRLGQDAKNIPILSSLQETCEAAVGLLI